MDVATILVMIAVLLMVLAYVFRPFLVRSDIRTGRTNLGSPDVLRSRAVLLSERNRVYAAIRALDFDYSTNKVADVDYAPQRYALVSQGVELLKHIDALPPLEETTADDPIEAAVVALRRSGRTAAAASGRARKAEGKGHQKTPARASFCPRCGKPVAQGDRFCGSCGAHL